MLFRLAVTCFFVLAGGGVATAKSLALVIGNDSYENVEPLLKARSDAEGYRAFFEQSGFDVTLHTDLAGRDMLVELVSFFDRIGPGDTVLFIYSGHGWSDGNENYLVPVDIRADGSQTLIAKESFPLRNGVNGILDEIAKRKPSLTVAIVDACRNNPFATRQGTRAVGLERGLVQVVAPVGTFIAFSAGEGQTALDRLSDDDPEPYSVFTRYFLQELGKPQDLQSAFKATQFAVNRSAQQIGHPQRPAYYDEVIGSACLTGACVPVLFDPDKLADADEAPPATPDRVLIAQQEWQDFKSTTSVDALTLFAERHAGTPYAALAAEKARVLLSQQQAAARDPVLDDPPAEDPPVEDPPEEVARLDPPPEPEKPPVDFARPKWCSAAATATEKTICANAKLAGLDLKMARLYFAGLRQQDESGKDRLKASQRAWISARNACRSDVRCLTRKYEDRIGAIQN